MHIPLAQAMGVSVIHLSQTVVSLSAPLNPNINHRSTAFGGSISALGILAAWTYLHVQLQCLSMPCRIVIQTNSIEYLRPIDTALKAHCFAPPQQSWERFIETISRRGKGRMTLNAEIHAEDLLAAKFQGRYVALRL